MRLRGALFGKCRVLFRLSEGATVPPAAALLLLPSHTCASVPGNAMLCGGYVCAKNALCALNILYCVSTTCFSFYFILFFFNVFMFLFFNVFLVFVGCSLTPGAKSVGKLKSCAAFLPYICSNTKGGCVFFCIFFPLSFLRANQQVLLVEEPGSTS